MTRQKEFDTTIYYKQQNVLKLKSLCQFCGFFTQILHYKKNLPICYRKKNIYQYTTFARSRSWRERFLKSFTPRTTLEVVHAKNDFHCTYPDTHQLRNITSSNSKYKTQLTFLISGLYGVSFNLKLSHYIYVA